MTKFGCTVILSLLVHPLTGAQPSEPHDPLPVKNGLWYLHVVSTAVGASGANPALYNGDAMYRFCIADSGKNTASLINLEVSDATSVRTSGDQRDRAAEWIYVTTKDLDIEMRLSFKSPMKASADGTYTTDDAGYKCTEHIYLEYAGEDCLGIIPGRRQGKPAGEWRYW